MLFTSAAKSNKEKPVEQLETKTKDKRWVLCTQDAVYRVRNSAIFDHWILVKLKKTTIFQLSPYRIRSLCPFHCCFLLSRWLKISFRLFDSGLWMFIVCLLADGWWRCLYCILFGILRLTPLLPLRSDLHVSMCTQESKTNLNSGTNEATPHLLASNNNGQQQQHPTNNFTN